MVKRMKKQWMTNNLYMNLKVMRKLKMNLWMLMTGEMLKTVTTRLIRWMKEIYNNSEKVLGAGINIHHKQPVCLNFLNNTLFKFQACSKLKSFLVKKIGVEKTYYTSH